VTIWHRPNRLFISGAVPAGLLLALLYILEMKGVHAIHRAPPRLLTVALLLLSATTALLIPLWLRIMLVRRRTGKRMITTPVYRQYQRQVMLSAWIAIYLLPLAAALQLARVPLFCVAMFALYALYYYYPSQRKIAFEHRLFGVENANQAASKTP
jgi:hypothetical protein